MDSYYYSMLFVLPPILYMSYHLTRILADKKKPTTHGLKAHPLLGHLPAFVNNSNRFLDWTTELIVGSPEMRMGFWIPGMRTGIITGNPADEGDRHAPGEPFGFDALREMHYLHAALTESMRLYPPAPIDLQLCAADDTLPEARSSAPAGR
uniref:Cytochrome P450 n=1 Tax=Oryza barthii TaxID=65489 RepID=A0A0D3HHY0_9ORYZ